MTTSTPTPGSRIRHSYKCGRRSPLITEQRLLDNGRIVTYHTCTGCAGNDVDTMLLIGRLLDRDDAA